MNNTLRKIFTFALVVATVVSTSGILSVNSVKAAAPDMSLIKMSGLSTVYYLQGGKRFVFPNQKTFMTWYRDFSSVLTVSQSELESYPLGGNVTYRPGVKLVKITTDPKVYAVGNGRTLHSIVSEANAIALWGSNWASNVEDVPDSFFTNYVVGAPLTAGMYGEGQLVKMANSADIYYYDGSTYRTFSGESSFMANRFSFAHVATAPADMTFVPMGATITGAESTLIDTASGSGGVVSTGTGLSVALASDTAASATLIYGQSNANLASFNFTASNDGNSIVNNLKLMRTGVSSDAILSAVYLFDGNTRLTDAATVSQNYITFNNPNGLFTVNAGQTKKITVRSDIGTVNDGASVAVQIAGATHVSASGATVTGSFPMTGNIMGVSSADLSTVLMNTTEPSVDASINAGQTDITVWKNSATIGFRDAKLEGLRLRMIGSISTSDLKDLKLYVGGVQAGTVQQIGNDMYVNFDLMSSPVTLTTGQRIIEVRGNLVGGSSKDFRFSLQQAVDVMVKDSQYDVYVKAQGVPAITAVQTVSAGSLSVTKVAGSPSGNVTKDASGATLAKYEFKAYGEPIKVEYLKATVNSNDNTVTKLRNGAIFANGAQIGSNADLAETDSVAVSTNYSLGSSLIVTPGTPVIVEIRADIFDNDGTNNITDNDTLVASLLTYASGAQRVNSFGFIPVPTADVAGNSLTVKTGSLTLAKQGTYPNQVAVIPQTNYMLGSFVLTGNDIEDVNLNSLQVDFTGVDQFTVARLSDVYVKYGSKTTTPKGTVIAVGNNWSITEPLAKNASMVIEVYGNVSNFTADGNDTMISSLLVAGTTVNSGQSVSTNGAAVLVGQTITAVAGGTIVSAVDGTTPVSALVVAGSTTPVAAYKFTTTNDSYTLTEVVVKVGADASTVVGNIILKDGATVLGTKPLAGTSATFSNLAVAVGANTSKTITAEIQLGNIGFGAGTSGADVRVSLDSFKASSSQGVESTEGTDRHGNSMYAYKSVPTITVPTWTIPALSNGAGLPIARFTVTADTNPVAWKKFIFSVIKSSAPIITVPTLWDVTGGANVQIAGTPAITTLGAANLAGSISFVADNEQTIASGTPKTYELRVTVGSSVQYDSVATNINQPSAYVAPTDYTTVAATTASFVWTDMSAQSHAVGTLDWNNAYLVKTLPTSSQTLSRAN